MNNKLILDDPKNIEQLTLLNSANDSYSQFEGYYKQTFPKYSTDAEASRVTTNKLINFDKVFGFYYMNNTQKYLQRLIVNFYAKDLFTGELIGLVENLTALTIEDNYETEIMSKIEVDLLIPLDKLNNILDKIKMNDNCIRFFIQLAPQDSKFDKIKESSFFFNYEANLQNYDPFFEIPLVLIENPRTDLIPNSASELKTPTRIKLFLLAETSLRLRKVQFSHKGVLDTLASSATNINLIVQSLIKNVATTIGAANIRTLIKPIDVVTPPPAVAFDNDDIFTIIKYLDQEYGTHAFGSVLYSEGRNLYMGDSQLESINNSFDLFIDVYNATDPLNNNGCSFQIANFLNEEAAVQNEKDRQDIDKRNQNIKKFIDNSKVKIDPSQISLLQYPEIKNTTKDAFYAIVSETQVSIHDHETSVKELAGERILVRMNGDDKDLLLPRSLTKNNLTGYLAMEKSIEQQPQQHKDLFAWFLDKFSAIFNSPSNDIISEKNARTVRYEKKNNACFFESRLISEINDSLGYITITFRGVNPDIFHHGKNAYIHFKTSSHALKYNWKYKVTSKKVLYETNSSVNPVIPQVSVTFKRVIDEIPYNLTDIANNKIFFNSTYDDTQKEYAKTHPISSKDSASGQTFDSKNLNVNGDLITVISSYATKYNIKPAILCAIVDLESTMNPNAINSIGAMGLFQFVPETGKKYDINSNNYTDINAMCEAGAHFTSDNIKYLKSHGVNTDDENNFAYIYIAHNLGVGGAASLKAGIKSGSTRDSVAWKGEKGPLKWGKVIDQNIPSAYKNATLETFYKWKEDAFNAKYKIYKDMLSSRVESINGESVLVPAKTDLISKYIKFGDVIVTTTAIRNFPSSKQDLEQIKWFASRILDPITEIFKNGVGSLLPVGLVINSCYRNEQVNEKVGGVIDSYHRKGLAGDLRFIVKSTNEVLVTGEKLKPYYEYIRDNQSIFIDKSREINNIPGEYVINNFFDQLIFEVDKNRYWIHLQSRYQWGANRGKYINYLKK